MSTPDTENLPRTVWDHATPDEHLPLGHADIKLRDKSLSEDGTSIYHPDKLESGEAAWIGALPHVAVSLSECR